MWQKEAAVILEVEVEGVAEVEGGGVHLLRWHHAGVTVLITDHHIPADLGFHG